MNYQRRLFNYRPLVIILLILILGALIAFTCLVLPSYTAITMLSVYIAVLLALAIISIIYKKPKYYIALIISIILVVLSAVSVFSVKAEYDREIFSGFTEFNGEVVEVKEYTKLNNQNYYKIVALGNVNGRENKVSFGVYTSYDIYVGAKVSFNAEIVKNTYLNENGESYLYSVIDREYYSAINVKNFNLKDANLSLFSKLKRNILINLKTYLPDNYGFSYALLLGDTAYINDGVLEGFRYSGVAHIFAVSGLHVGFLYGFISALLKLLKVKNKPKIIITIFILFLYVAFCGFTPSCMRAFLVLTFISLSDLIGIKGDKLSMLSLSAIVISLYNPYYLLSIGFILSYVTYISLLVLTEPIKELFSKAMPTKVATYLAPYTSAYLGSFPIVISAFGYYSCFAMLFNMIILPIVSVAFILNFISVICLLISPYLSFATILPNVIFTALSWFITRVNYLAFVIKGVRFGFSIVLYYLILLFSTREINLQPKTRGLILKILIFTFILTFSMINIGVLP